MLGTITNPQCIYVFATTHTTQHLVSSRQNHNSCSTLLEELNSFFNPLEHVPCLSFPTLALHKVHALPNIFWQRWGGQSCNVLLGCMVINLWYWCGMTHIKLYELMKCMTPLCMLFLPKCLGKECSSSLCWVDMSHNGHWVANRVFF